MVFCSCTHTGKRKAIRRFLILAVSAALFLLSAVNTAAAETVYSDPGIAFLGLIRNDGGSMENTLRDGEIFSVVGSEYGSDWQYDKGDSNNQAERAPRVCYGEPGFLDVVVCRYPGRGALVFVKRITGMPGDTVSLKDGYLYINGAQVPEEAAIEGIEEDSRNHGLMNRDFGPYYVPRKGDRAVILPDDRTGFRLEINGNAWERKNTCLNLEAGGKTLQICERNIDEDSRDTSYSIRLKTVFVCDGEEYSPEEFMEAHPELVGSELAVNEDYYFVLGDHRNNSNDSRNAGALERSAIIRHVMKVVYPLSAARVVK